MPISTIKHALSHAEELGLLEHTIQRLRPTKKGQLYLNSLIELFLAA
jgi:oxygen-independent coproporphyrinogen-3 oxidase